MLNFFFLGMTILLASMCIAFQIYVLVLIYLYAMVCLIKNTIEWWRYLRPKDHQIAQGPWAGPVTCQPTRLMAGLAWYCWGPWVAQWGRPSADFLPMGSHWAAHYNKIIWVGLGVELKTWDNNLRPDTLGTVVAAPSKHEHWHRYGSDTTTRTISENL